MTRWARLVTAPGYVCSDCPDETKALRRCPKPMRSPGVWQVPPGDPSCPVLEVEPWYWDAVRLGSMIERGAVTTSEIAAHAWELAEAAWHSLGEARKAHAWAAEQRRKAIERHTTR